MENNKDKSLPEKEEKKEKELQDKKNGTKEKSEEEKDFGGLPARKLGKNLGCGG